MAGQTPLPLPLLLPLPKILTVVRLALALLIVTTAVAQSDPLHCRYDVPRRSSKYPYRNRPLTTPCKLVSNSRRGMPDPTLNAMYGFTPKDTGSLWGSSINTGPTCDIASTSCLSCRMRIPKFAVDQGVVPLSVNDGWWLYPEPGATCGMCFKVSLAKGTVTPRCSMAKAAGDWTKYFSYSECPMNGGSRYNPPNQHPWSHLGKVYTDSTGGEYVLGINVGGPTRVPPTEYAVQAQPPRQRAGGVVDVANLAGQLTYNPGLQSNPAAVKVHISNVQSAQGRSVSSEVKRVEYILYGDSITERGIGRRFGDLIWPGRKQKIFERYFGNSSLSLGISSDASFNLLYRVKHGELGTLRPKVVVILIGSNDMLRSRFRQAAANPAAWAVQTAAAVKQTIDFIFSQSPSTKVLLQAVLPRSGSSRQWPNPAIQKIWTEINTWYRRIAASDPSRIGFVDCGWAILSNDGKSIPADLSEDVVHPSEKGYHRMYPCVLAAAKRLLEGRSSWPLTVQPTPCPVDKQPLEYAFVTGNKSCKLRIAGQRIAISRVEIQWQGEKRWTTMVRSGVHTDSGFGDGDGHWQLPAPIAKPNYRQPVNLRIYCTDGAAPKVESGLVPSRISCSYRDPDCRRFAGQVQC